jgi:hypothetical protein
MKLKPTYILLFLLTFTLSSNIALAQAVFPNDIILQPYYGAPNMKKWMYDTDINENNSSKGFGHIGLSGEFVLSKWFGLGFDAIYSPFSRTEQTNSIEYNGNTGTYTNQTTEYTFKENKLRVIAKVYIHFNVANPLWDLYISGGLGTNTVFARAFINGDEVNYYENYINNNTSIILQTPFPFAGRICFGARYFFSNHFGVNFETGFGGPPFSFGMNFRF